MRTIGILTACLAMAAEAPGQVATRDTGADRWVATDALGRSIPGPEEVGPPREGKFVAIFYFLWLDGEVSRENGGPFDLSKILAGSPDRPTFGPPGAFHWWGEPRFGYYLGDDEFVLRKHAQMLADAGVDAIALDVTNGPTYEHNLLALCRVFERIRSEGGKTPQLFFLANSGAPEVSKRLYERFYSKNLHPDLWFRWKGKPLLLAPPEGLDPAVAGFFHVRRSWAWSDPGGWFGDGKDKWTWIDNHPQVAGWHDDPKRPEEVSVGVAGHPVNNLGRSFHDGEEPPPDRRKTGEGACFAEQWKRALEIDPELIFVTGWNEWIAQRFVARRDGDVRFLGRPIKAGETFFVDQYSPEFSRDIEPMRGGHSDNYYYQLVSNVRRFKGVRPASKASAPRSIRIDGDFAQWADVGPEYLDDLHDPARRDHPGWGPEATAPRYRNASGRNDLDAAKVARDGESLAFYLRAREPIASTDGLILFLDVDSDPRTGWEGFDFVVNRSTRAGLASVERNLGGWKWGAVAESRMVVRGRELHLAIPRSSLGLDASRRPIRLNFQWADNVPDSGDIVDFLDHGDAAPNGRARYRFEE